MHTLGFGFPGHWEWVALVVIGLLLFGRRLPEVGRNVGRAIVEFKKGVKGISEEIEEESSKSGGKLESGEKARLASPSAPTVAQESAHAEQPRSGPATE
ncbi:MAG: twin-arginine translocase TatA/TatE family subunit [Phycisphaerales bacterium JB039]